MNTANCFAESLEQIVVNEQRAVRKVDATRGLHKVSVPPFAHPRWTIIKDPGPFNNFLNPPSTKLLRYSNVHVELIPCQLFFENVF